ncbi:MAG: DUF58 domain-containing protein, partial [Streptosporangiaceae bacterium]
MALTGRAALVALIGTLAMLLLRTRNGLILVDGLIAAAIVADIILAASVRQLSFARSGDTRILLGQQGTATLTITNPGRRQLRGVVRDAWQPSLGASGRARVAIPPGGQIAVTTTLAPTRRGDRAAGKVTVRSVG